MRMGIGLNLEQTQKLIITPELRQAITILQLSTQELMDYLEQELMENPVLEMKEEVEEKEVKETSLEEENEQFDVNWQEYFSDGSDLGYIRSPREHRSEEVTFEQFVSEATSLHEHLYLQLNLSLPPGQQRRIGNFLIGSIDDNGYLRTSIEEAAACLKCSPAEVEEALKLVQSFDPPGVGARNLAECLLQQLSQLKADSPLVVAIVQSHLEDLAAGRITRIAKALDISPVEVQDIGDLIRTLDPKPGRQFGGNQDARYIVPDAVIEKVAGKYVVLINEQSGPRLGINPVYRSLVRREMPCDDHTIKFIEGKLNSALWVIRSIEQRRLTLYRVVSSIVDFQMDFLEKGIKHLKPLNLRQVADTLEMHESTVSRAIANKYVQTPQGVYELKFFFASGVERRSGTAIASDSIKKMLQEFIQCEDPGEPLTDQALTDLLNGQGIRISRRTVAKYRDEMDIPPATRRKRF
ncbi:MAG TPA: RNA polymerase factor sigma-54 [Clostridia bacterium]|nr:RNA polymerase factor sigma-54 [Clostridia bacterium]